MIPMLLLLKLALGRLVRLVISVMVFRFRF
jgi:hypothetical protein